MRLVKKMDAGDILLQKRIPIPEDMLAQDLFLLLAKAGAPLIIETIEGLQNGTVQGTPQDESQSTYAGKLSKSDASIDWSKSARAIHNQIRAFHIWPGSKTTWKKKVLTLVKSCYSNQMLSPDAYKTTGKVICVDRAKGIGVSTGDGTLWIEVLKPEGKKEMLFKDFLNGSPLKEGDVFN